MTTSMLAFGKASAAGNLKAHLSTKAVALSKLYTTAPAGAPATASTNSNSNTHRKPADPVTQRDLFMNVLNANATKRDAKQYLARFRRSNDTPVLPALTPLQEERNARNRQDQDRLDRVGVNLGALYAPARAIAESPQFTREDVVDKTPVLPKQKIHVALVCLRTPEDLDDAILDGVALTLSQLVKLDMRIVLVLDCKSQTDRNLKDINIMFAEQSKRLHHAFARSSSEGTRLVTGAMEVMSTQQDVSDANATVETSVGIPNAILDPLKRSIVPIVPTMAYTQSGRLVQAHASSVMSALSAMLSGVPSESSLSGHSAPKVKTSLDRIIVLDSAGGIPSKARGDGAHVFINLEQEFNEIEAELAEYGRELSRLARHGKVASVYDQHRSNLRIARDCLATLPSASSALIITPEEAATSSLPRAGEDSTTGTGTRPQKNTLIHNLLTNKPIVSSSLPAARMRSLTATNDNIPPSDMFRATLVKRGMPLITIPTPEKGSGWQVPADGKTILSIEDDRRVNLPKLVRLINDSFRRKLDVRDYLTRICDRTAGLIIAGDYEGAAVLTWEMPPGTNDSARLVPYLDKFAVLSSSQGSSGVADIVFQSMVRTCFPNGVCWRSRKDNPVNKWYFERADGMWQIPDSNWTMFWTGSGVVEDEQRWNDYVGVCRAVQPSWLDGKKPD